MVQTKAKGSWYKLYVQVDTDRSGKIAFDEFERVARRSFELSHEELPSAKLKTLWCRRLSERYSSAMMLLF